jgi:hypothetical protein
MRFDLSDEEWALLEPLLPKSRKSARVADYPEPLHRYKESLLPQAHLPAAPQDRKLLLPYQGLAAYRHPLRQARAQLPGRYHARRGALLDQIVSPDPSVNCLPAQSRPITRI